MSAPKLRFKEFDVDWAKYKIAEATEYLVDGTHFSPKSTKGEFKYITSKNIRNDGLDLSNISYISKEEHGAIYKRCKVKLDDILLTKDGANTGNCCLNTLDEEFSLLSSVAVLRGKIGSFDNKFLLQILQSDLGQNTIISSMSGQAITRITLSKLKDYSFKFPNFSEQTKIASFLSQVDEKISQLTQKHKLLSQYKQGMMQKLFSQQIRFKADDGSEFGEWEETTIGQTGRFIGGGTPSKENPQFWEGSIPWISSSDLTEESIFQVNISRYISEEALKQSATKLIPANSILIVSRVGVGKIAITPNDICTSQDFTSLSLLQGNSIFFAYLIKSLTPYLLEMNQGTSIKGFVKDDLASLKIYVPCLEEQNKIANFLSAIDQKIEVVTQQIKQAKTWKKGLLQQMFV